ncbi:hypothetical protein KJK34_06010 [Flavobacterium sp. D11R37]|uniref:hypothetical protein n=1 Tax=Flavobacterium coralii TaxID=2838017 RepID=UPI001CA66266|nr:hypothetical protein [Flavobacterium coralii]MBY8962302.1 hypothetical protein [Flavobacterium coralii]
MKLIVKLLFIALVFASCEDVEPIVYNGNIEQNQTFLSFSRSSYLLPVVQNTTGEVVVTLNSSTVADYDRTYNLEVTLPDNQSAANPETFEVPSTITIPAGEYQGFITITGVDNNLVDENRKSFTITITNVDENTEIADSNSAVINIYEVCPLQDDFLGQYQVQVIQPWLAPTLPAFSAGVVTLTQGDTPFERVFTANVYPGYCGATQLTIAFACNFVNLSEEVETCLRCTSDPADLLITFAPVDLDMRSPYNTNDDSYFELTFNENSVGNCGDGDQFTVVTFTKVE